MTRWLLPPITCLLVFWRVPFIWFRMDDFAWLGLRLESSLWSALFHPQAQGTVRVLSERVPFLVFSSWFGIYAAPFRALTLLTWIAALTLMQWIGAKLTGSRAAGLLGALLWTTCAAITTPLDWASCYNQVLCAALALLAFHARLRWIEGGDTRWRWLEAGAFLLCFGVSELIVVYPAIVLLHAWATRRPARDSLWMFVPAVVFGGLHLFVIPKSPSPIYRMTLDPGIAARFLRYVAWTVGTVQANTPQRIVMLIAMWITGFALASFALFRGGRQALFYGGWFLLWLAPVLPLANHATDYYVTIPAIGLAWLAASAIVAAWKSGWMARTAAVLLMAAYLVSNIVEIDALTAFHLRVSSRMRAMMRALEGTMAAHPGSALVLLGVDPDLFDAGFRDDPFRLVGAEQAWLAPQDDQPSVGRERFRTSPEAVLALVEANRARVLDVSGDAPLDVTTRYGQVLRVEQESAGRSFVDVGNPVYASSLGEGWYAPENGARWTARSASVSLPAPRTASEKLRVTGYAAAPALRDGPLQLRFSISGRSLGIAALSNAGAPFSLEFGLPPELVGAARIDLRIECSRTFRPPNDPRDLGVIVRTIEIR